MPEVDGINIYEQVKKQHPALADHFAFMTGSLYTPDVEAFFRRVSAPCIVKPFDKSQLIKILLPMLPDRMETDPNTIAP